MEFKNIAVERDESILIILMNRADAMNALNSETFHELNSLFDDIEGNEDIRVVIISGAGKAFVAGADIAEMKDMDGKASRAFSKLGQQVMRRMELMEKVFIAAVNGFALGGGCEFAMCCDIRIASEKAKFGQPEVNLGVTPGFAGTQRLPRLVGLAKAKELLFTGALIDAQTAYHYGLVTQIVSPEVLMDEAKKMASKILSKGPLSIKMVKACVNSSQNMDIDTGSDFEADAFGLCFASGQTKEGMSAFLEKRDPKFK